MHNKPSVYKAAVKLLPLKWKPHRDEIAFQFMAGMDTQKPGQILRSRTQARTY
jgi:hypothetical protein